MDSESPLPPGYDIQHCPDCGRFMNPRCFTASGLCIDCADDDRRLISGTLEHRGRKQPRKVNLDD